jgi:uncharacterized Zn finger protein (UPF0148 family)
MFFYTCPSCGAPAYSSANASTVGACPRCSEPLTGADAPHAEVPAEGSALRADLGRALIDQARLGDAYERAVGTSAEQSAFVRLQRAGREVAQCDRDVRDDRDETG